MTAHERAGSSRPKPGNRVSSVPPAIEQVVAEGMFNVDKFVESFDVLVEAVGGYPALRSLILQLALTGRLETWNSSDTHANELVTAIQGHRNRLLLSGRVKKLPELEPLDNAQGSIPTGWVRAKLGTLLVVIRGASPRPKGDPRFFSSTRTPFHWIKISDLRKHSRDDTLLDTDEFLTKEGTEHSVLVSKGALILTNSATIGVPMFMGIDGYIHDGFLAFPHFPAKWLDYRYFFLQLQTLSAHLVSAARGLAQLNLNSEIVRNAPILLPPIAEQKRIVARVDQLMALIDDLEQKQIRKRQLGAYFTKASLEALTAAETPEDFDGAWKRVVENWGVVIDRAEKVGRLRMAVLELAIRGRLLCGVANAADALNSDFRMEGDVPFALPTAWRWMPLRDVAERTDYGTSQKAHQEPRGIPVLRMNNIQDGRLDLASLKYVPETMEGLPGLLMEPGDLLFNRTNSYELVGKMAVFREKAKYTFASYLIRVRLNALVVPEYVNSFFGSWTCRVTQIEPNVTKQTNQANFNGTKLKEILVPVPPLAEQKRIVAKVDHLMKLCDELEAKLRRSEDRASKLVEAVVQEMVG